MADEKGLGGPTDMVAGPNAVEPQNEPMTENEWRNTELLTHVKERWEDMGRLYPFKYDDGSTNDNSTTYVALAVAGAAGACIAAGCLGPYVANNPTVYSLADKICKIGLGVEVLASIAALKNYIDKRLY